MGEIAPSGERSDRPNVNLPPSGDVGCADFELLRQGVARREARLPSVIDDLEEEAASAISPVETRC